MKDLKDYILCHEPSGHAGIPLGAHLAPATYWIVSGETEEAAIENWRGGESPLVEKTGYAAWHKLADLGVPQIIMR